MYYLQIYLWEIHFTSIYTTPKYKVSCEYPFENVGVDYAGPLFIRDIYSKSKEMHKCYNLLFTCVATHCIQRGLLSGFHADTLL